MGIDSGLCNQFPLPMQPANQGSSIKGKRGGLGVVKTTAMDQVVTWLAAATLRGLVAAEQRLNGLLPGLLCVVYWGPDYWLLYTLPCTILLCGVALGVSVANNKCQLSPSLEVGGGSMQTPQLGVIKLQLSPQPVDQQRQSFNQPLINYAKNVICYHQN